jgi:hypothetical protein
MWRVLALCGAFLVTAPGIAAAEWHLTPMAGWTVAGRTSLFDPQDATGKTHRQIGGAATLVGKGLFGAETVFVFVPGLFRRDGTGLPAIDHTTTFALMGNTVVTLPRRWTEYSLRPFISGGFGVLHADLRTTRVGPADVRVNVPGFDLGGGAVGFLSPRTGIRFDLRYYSSLHRSDQGSAQGPVSIGRAHLSYLAASVGLVFRR